MVEYTTTSIIDIIRDFKRMDILMRLERKKKIENN